MSIAQNNQSNYATERADARLSPATVEQAKSIAVGQQQIDPELAASVDQNGWIYHFRRRAEEAEKMLEVQTDRANELDQGCSWLAEALRATEACWNLAEHECTEVAGRLAVEQNRHDTTKRLLNDLARRAEEAEAVIDGLCNHDPDVVSALYFSSQKRKAAEREVSRLEAKCEQIELAYSDVCDELEAGAKRGNELADVIRQIAACDQTSGFENPVLEVPAELYQRLMRVAAALGVK